MKRKPPALRNIGIDLDIRAIEGFECDYPVELHHGCAHAFLSDFDFQGDELVYADPPYVLATRKSQRRYRHYYTDDDHVELLDILKSLPAQVMISGYPSRLYDEHLSDWRTVSLQVNNQSCVVTEKLWFNYEPDRVHWFWYAGRDFTRRQAIKRKAEGRGRRYEKLSRAERLAVLAAMMAVEVEP